MMIEVQKMCANSVVWRPDVPHPAIEMYVKTWYEDESVICDCCGMPFGQHGWLDPKPSSDDVRCAELICPGTTVVDSGDGTYGVQRHDGRKAALGL